MQKGKQRCDELHTKVTRQEESSSVFVVAEIDQGDFRSDLLSVSDGSHGDCAGYRNRRLLEVFV